jgi:hypothetical protein
MVLMESKAELPEIVRASYAQTSAPYSLHCGQREGDEDSGDGDDYYQLRQGEGTSTT